jgi:GAF domain
MADQKQSELASAPTQPLPSLDAAAQEDSPKFVAEQKHVEELINDDAPLIVILSELVLMIEAQSPETLCSILLLSDDGNHVRHAVAPSLPENYTKAIDGSPIGPKHGSCGTAMFRGKPVVVTDIATDPLWDDYREFARIIDMAACWSTPIMSSKGKVRARCDWRCSSEWFLVWPPTAPPQHDKLSCSISTAHSSTACISTYSRGVRHWRPVEFISQSGAFTGRSE